MLSSPQPERSHRRASESVADDAIMAEVQSKVVAKLKDGGLAGMFAFA
jgi:hypothetical protein